MFGITLIFISGNMPPALTPPVLGGDARCTEIWSSEVAPEVTEAVFVFVLFHIFSSMLRMGRFPLLGVFKFTTLSYRV